MTDRLPTALWVEAHIRQCTAAGKPVYVAQKGNYAGGLVLLKINMIDSGVRVLVQQRNIEGVLGWMDVFESGPAEESEADEYIARAARRDPDLWVIEVEDKDGENPFEGRVF